IALPSPQVMFKSHRMIQSGFRASAHVSKWRQSLRRGKTASAASAMPAASTRIMRGFCRIAPSAALLPAILLLMAPAADAEPRSEPHSERHTEPHAQVKLDALYTASLAGISLG